MRGVIHPSFPLRGRWERPALVIEQAPSPSLADLCKSSIGMRPRFSDSARCWPNPVFPFLFKIPFFLFMFRLSLLIFGALACCINPDSGERSPASGIHAFLPDRPHLTCAKIEFRANCNPLAFLQIWTNDPVSRFSCLPYRRSLSTSTHFQKSTTENLEIPLTHSNVKVQTHCGSLLLPP
jgi:hypothetical protein